MLTVADTCPRASTDNQCLSFVIVKFDMFDTRLCLFDKGTKCGLDPIPMSLVFECSDEIVPLFIAIVNQSLSTGIFFLKQTNKQTINTNKHNNNKQTNNNNTSQLFLNPKCA